MRDHELIKAQKKIANKREKFYKSRLVTAKSKD